MSLSLYINLCPHSAVFESDSHAVAKIEVMSQGINRRFAVTNIKDSPQAIYHGFYVQRGNVPERSIGELKNGLAIDRLSSHRFLANA